jgi:hypothetical protein
MKTIILAGCLLSAGLASPVLAANATHPYQNCDRKNDNCGPTGDDKTDQLNAQQLGGSAQATPDTSAPMQQSQ